jgi:succinoglycan biosynthesis transport protein ExoP
MRRRRGGLPVLAEVFGPAPGEARVWSLRRADVESLAPLLEQLARRRSVLVTGEERSVGSIALAAAASAAGRRTALLECDLARPRLAAELGLAAAPGLHEYLRWEATAPEILQTLALGGPAAARVSSGLVCVVAGRPATDTATLLGLDSFRHAAAKLRRAYDLLVLSGPGLDSDRATLDASAAPVDALLTSVPSGQTSGRSGRGLRTALRRLSITPLGAIVVAGTDPAQRS